MKLADCMALDQLPYFEKDERGKLRLAAGVADKIIDFHTHIGLNYLFTKPVDLDRIDDEAKPFFPLHGNPVDLDVYSAVSFTPENAKLAEKETLKQAYTSQGWHETHTPRNLLDEMDRFRVTRAVILAIDFPLGPLSCTSEHYLRAAKKYPRLIPFISVHPYNPFMTRRVKKLVAAGGVGMKIHPANQLMNAANDRCMKLSKLCGELGLPCLYHTGASDIAPKWQQDLPHVKYFWKPVAEQPDTVFIFGHAGIHYYKEAIELGKAYNNVYLELSGQPPARIREMIDGMGPDRLLFGSDWPYYTEAVPLAKVLLATEGMPEVRKKILYDNGRALLERFKILQPGD